MDELVKLVAEKTGLNEELSRIAVDTVVNYLKSKLPEAVGSQIDVVLDGGDVTGDVGGLTKGLSSLFGKG